MIPSVRDRLQHILESIDYIESFLQDDFSIGEACRHVPSEFRKEFSDIPWVNMLGLRNVLAHEYFQLDEERIQHAIAKLPLLKSRLQQVIQTLNTSL